MTYQRERLEAIYRRTDGYCHICHKKLAFINHGKTGSRGAWHVDHSRPQAKGGSDHGNNLYAACVSCNTSKRDGLTRSARSKNGRARAPYSREKKELVKSENVAIGVLGGLLAGGVIAGPPGAFVGAVFGGLVGHERKVI